MTSQSGHAADNGKLQPWSRPAAETAIAPIIEQLGAQKSELESRQSALADALAELDAELNRIKNALSVLNGSARSKQKPAANRDAVRTALRKCWSAQPSLETADLKAAIGKELLAEGYSRSGLALRLKEVLLEEEFLAFAGISQEAPQEPNN